MAPANHTRSALQSIYPPLDVSDAGTFCDAFFPCFSRTYTLSSRRTAGLYKSAAADAQDLTRDPRGPLQCSLHQFGRRGTRLFLKLSLTLTTNSIHHDSPRPTDTRGKPLARPAFARLTILLIVLRALHRLKTK